MRDVLWHCYEGTPNQKEYEGKSVYYLYDRETDRVSQDRFLTEFIGMTPAMWKEREYGVSYYAIPEEFLL